MKSHANVAAACTQQCSVSSDIMRAWRAQEWEKIWALNKRVIDPVCPRHTAVAAAGRVLLRLSNGPAAPEVVTLPRHKKHPPAGVKATTYTKAGAAGLHARPARCLACMHALWPPVQCWQQSDSWKEMARAHGTSSCLVMWGGAGADSGLPDVAVRRRCGWSRRMRGCWRRARR